jgi:hypothetical protein
MSFHPGSVKGTSQYGIRSPVIQSHYIKVLTPVTDLYERRHHAPSLIPQVNYVYHLLGKFQKDIRL